LSLSAEVRAGGQGGRQVCGQRFPLKTLAAVDYGIRIEEGTLWAHVTQQRNTLRAVGGGVRYLLPTPTTLMQANKKNSVAFSPQAKCTD
jgi:hypothetical protein